MKRLGAILISILLAASALGQSAGVFGSDSTLSKLYLDKFYFIQNRLELPDNKDTKNFWHTYVEYHEIFLALDKELKQSRKLCKDLDGRELQVELNYMNKIHYTASVTIQKFHKKISKQLNEKQFSEYIKAENEFIQLHFDELQFNLADVESFL